MPRLSLVLIPLAALVLAPRPASADEKELRATLAEAIKAHGGAAKLNKYLASTATLKGKISVMGMRLDFTGEVATQLPDKLKVNFEIKAGGDTIKLVQVVNKDRGWSKINDTVAKMSKDELAEVRKDLHVTTVTTQLTTLLTKEYTLATLGDVKVGDKPAIGIRVSRKGFRDVNLYFDKKTLLLARAEYRAKDDEGNEVTQATYYSDYEDVSGVKVAHRIRIKRDDKDYLDARITDGALEEKLSDDTFAEP
jgi:hypothetical protein